MPHPDPPTHTILSDEKLCYTCKYYCFVARPADDPEYGWAFCRYHNKWFTDQQNGKPAGERHCKNWE